MAGEGAHVGVLRMTLQIPGARSLKDRRQVLRSLKDRVAHRFEVTWHEVAPLDQATRAGILCTTGGADARRIRSVLDRVHAFVEASGRAWSESVDVDVFRWHPPQVRWEPEGDDV